MKLYKIFFVFIAILISCGCCIPKSSEIHPVESGKAYIVDSDATRRNSVVSNKDGSIQFISEPSPDVALSIADKYSSELKIKDIVDANSKVEIMRQIVNLGNRTEAITLVREILFRISEISKNGSLAKDGEVKELLIKALDVCVDLVRIEKNNQLNETIQKVKSINGDADKSLEIIAKIIDEGKKDNNNSQ